jgi:hypothetical protein
MTTRFLSGGLTARTLLLVICLGLGHMAVLAVPVARRFFALDAPPPILVLAVVGSAALGRWVLRLLGTAGPALRRRPRPPVGLGVPPDVPALAAAGESAAVEFMASMRRDVQERPVNRTLEPVVAKTVAGCPGVPGRAQPARRGRRRGRRPAPRRPADPAAGRAP